jgi:hypothetical protein
MLYNDRLLVSYYYGCLWIEVSTHTGGIELEITELIF